MSNRLRLSAIGTMAILLFAACSNAGASPSASESVAASGVPQARQNRASGGFSWPHAAQLAATIPSVGPGETRSL